MANEIVVKNERKHFALFLGHLSLEKMLKALFVKLFDVTPPYKHDLYLLAEKCKLSLNEQVISDLKIINEFTIQARYPDYKNDFYKKCTIEFVETELKRIGKLRLWIQDILKNML
ncbi:MAG: HEPN domain-containing protein [Ignavibacteriaceae bacterium]